MTRILKRLFVVFLTIPALAVAQVRNTLIGPHATVQTDGSISAGEVNLMTSSAGPINFYTNKTKRGYIDGTTGALTGFTFGSLNLLNNTYLTAKDAAGTGTINVLKVDGSDDTVLNADTGDTVNLAVAGTSVVTVNTTGLLPSVDGNSSTSNLGSSSFGFKNIYLSDGTDRSSLIQSNGLYIAAPSSQRMFFRIGSTDAVQIASGSSSNFQINWGDGGTTATQKLNIAPKNLSGDNDASLYLCAGGLNGGTECSAAFGAVILMDGENTANKGDIQISTGDAAGSDMYLDMAATNSTVIFRDAGTNHQLWTYSVDGNITQNATYGGNLVMAKAGTGLILGKATVAADAGTTPGIYNFTGSATSQQAIFAQGTADTAGVVLDLSKSRATDGTADTIIANGDTIGTIRFRGADGASFITGAAIQAFSAATPGSGDMPMSLAFQTVPDGSSSLATVLTLTSEKVAGFAGTITSSRTTDLGWSSVAGANTACNTTCTSACVFGIDTGSTTNSLLACTDATADVCLCAGAS